MYPVIADPPLEAGALHDTTACPAPAATAGDVGAPGVVNGVTVCDADAALLPAAFSDVTVTVYVEPAVKPLIVHVVADAPAVHDWPPG